MKRMEEAKKRYENISIPKELSERIMQEIKKSEEKQRKKIRREVIKKGFAAAAAVTVLFTAAVNTNTAFAESIRDIPVIGAIAKVLTFRSYEIETDDLKISVDIPSIKMITEEMNHLEKSVNEEIYNLCKQYADEAVERAEEYRQAFLDTGGTEKEWEEHHIEIRVWYEVKSQTENNLSLMVMGSESWSSAYSEVRYYNFDLTEGKQVTLEDVLGENYILIVNESVQFQMEERKAENGQEYWDDFQGIDESTKFYINEAGNPVIVFDKYEVAPGAYGQQEFEIIPK